MYIVRAEADRIERIVDISIRAFETDVTVSGAKGDCPPAFDSIEWHSQMAREGKTAPASREKERIIYGFRNRKTYTPSVGRIGRGEFVRIREG